MATTTTNNNDGTFTLDDGEGHVVTVSLKDINEPGWVGVDLLFADGIHQDPIRLKMSNSNGRIAADHPTCNAGYCIVDGNGKITNG